MRARAAVGSLLLAWGLAGLSPAGEPERGPEELKRLKLRSIGPAVGGRVSTAQGVPGDPRTYYAAASGGGVWKSTDGGFSWGPVLDDQPVSSIGSLAVAPSDPNVIYVGSGEANIRGNVQAGNGIYRSTDAGKTWRHVWKHQAQIGRMLVHPRKPEVAYAAVMGRAFGPSEERGVYRTRDGGKTWERVLHRNPDTGASDVCMDPSNPRVLLAGLWQGRRYPWDLISGGPGSGLHLSRDGGDSWTRLLPPPKDLDEAAKDPPKGVRWCKGLPHGIWGRVGVAIAPSDSRRIYALIEAEKGGLYRSDDGGETWEHVNDHQALRQRAWYFSTLTVHPRDADVVWLPQVPLLKSIDGGKTLSRVKGTHHGDHHQIWIDPTNPDRIVDSNDGGVDISLDGGESWYAPPLPICQFYHISVDTRRPYHVLGTIQDIGTASGPSNSLSSDGIRLSDWRSVGGGEAGYAVADPRDPHVVYAGSYGGWITRYDDRTRQEKSVCIYPYNPSGHAPSTLKYRFQWTAPILASRHESAVYHAANVLFRSTDGGQTWEAISPDLTRNDRTKQQWAGGPITGDNTGVEVYGTIFALAESPLEKGLLWAGSDDGLLHVSSNGGKSWTNVTPKRAGMPGEGAVVCVEPSPHDARTAYVVIERHRLDDVRPFLFRTTDLGKTWTFLAEGLPQDDYLRVVREDPTTRGLLYLGSEKGLSFSHDDGKTWTPLKLNLPTVPVADLAVKDDDLVVGTNGRSIWVLDDLTPVRKIALLKGEKAGLLEPRPTVRHRYHGDLDGNFQRWRGENPPEGALLHYFLPHAPKKLAIEILDQGGNVIRRLTDEPEPKEIPDIGGYSEPRKPAPGLAKEPGLHRVVWDLRHTGGRHILNARVDAGRPFAGAMALPGTYTVRLIADDETATAPLRLLLDPRQANPDGGPSREVVLEGLRRQLDLSLEIRDDISRLTGIVLDLRRVRKQLKDRNALLAEQESAKPLIEASEQLIGRLDALEEELHNPRAQGSYDILAQKGGAKLYSQLTWVYSQLLGSDGTPTQGIREVHAEEHQKLDRLQKEWRALLAKELTRLNGQAAALEVPGIILPAGKE